MLTARGLKVFQTTICPRTTSTDNWTTTTNQTPYAHEDIRVALNDWIRTCPAPLSGFFDAADLAETSRNSGIWKVGYPSDGTHITKTGAIAISACIDTSKFV
jgi:hypothetical protein